MGAHLHGDQPAEEKPFHLLGGVPLSLQTPSSGCDSCLLILGFWTLSGLPMAKVPPP